MFHPELILSSSFSEIVQGGHTCKIRGSYDVKGDKVSTSRNKVYNVQ